MRLWRQSDQSPRAPDLSLHRTPRVRRTTRVHVAPHPWITRCLRAHTLAAIGVPRDAPGSHWLLLRLPGVRGPCVSERASSRRTHPCHLPALGPPLTLDDHCESDLQQCGFAGKGDGSSRGRQACTPTRRCAGRTCLPACLELASALMEHHLPYVLLSACG